MNKPPSIAILTGGTCDEKEISLLSATNIFETIKNLDYRVKIFDIRLGLYNLLPLLLQYTVIFPVLHGFEGEDGKLSYFLEKNKLQFIGPTSSTCHKSWNKRTFKNICKSLGIKTPDWFIATRKTINNMPFIYPVIIKPLENGSSIDVQIVGNKEDLNNIATYIFDKYHEVMIESYITGIEVTVGILEKKVLPLIEIQTPNKELFTYDNKYNGKTKEIPFAPSLLPALQEKIKKIALRIHRELGFKYLSRTDFIITKDQIYVLEINSIPGLTNQSLFPKAVEAAGFTFEEAISQLIHLCSKK